MLATAAEAVEGVVIHGNLKECEDAIDRFQRSYQEAGQALLDIYENELWREGGYEDFVDYVDRRWDKGKTEGYRLLDAGRFVRYMSVNRPSLPLPANQSHIRPLLKVHAGKDQPEDETWKWRANAWEQILREAGDQVITAEFVESMVDRYYRGQKKPKEKKPPVYKLADLEDACALIMQVANQYPADKICEEFGDTDGWLYFEAAREYLNAIADA